MWTAVALAVDLILHAGDLVTLAILDELQTLAPVLAVHGNVDHPEVQERLPSLLRIEVGAKGVVKVDGLSGSMAGRISSERRAKRAGAVAGPAAQAADLQHVTSSVGCKNATYIRHARSDVITEFLAKRRQ